jgi:3-oxoacyl-[acyl-carrier protein] reductase
MKQTVLITGGSRGIGAATALAFAQAGYQVAINYPQREEAALSLCCRIQDDGGSALAVQGDVGNSADVSRMVAEVEQAFGSIDVLVCNAGIAHVGLLPDMTDDQWHRLFAVDVDGVFYACRAVLPGMIRRHCGRIVTVSSMWGVTGGSCEVAYSAAKAAVIGLTRALAKEVGPSGITVNCVAPGVIDTEMNGQLDEASMAALREETPLERIGTPEDVAQSILFLASDRASFITGQVLQCNGGIVIG